MPKLSVLMPVYNAERFLKEAIDSTLEQTFKDFEFLIIDDCSTDNSAQIIHAYADHRIRYYRNEKNLGISATLNRGIGLSNAEWIARMDADDVNYTNRLQRQMDFIQQHPDGILFSCSVKVVDEERSFLRQDIFDASFYYYNQNFICWIYHPSVIFKKSAVLDVGMYTVPYAEDFEIFWQLTRKYKHYHQEEVLMDYRVTNQSLHQVQKKKEYALAQQNQILRNIKYYTGENYNLPLEHIEALQHNFEPLLHRKNVKEIVLLLNNLDFITSCILNKENINRNMAADSEAAHYKKKFIIDQFVKKLPPLKALTLLYQLGMYSTIIKLPLHKFKKFKASIMY